MKGDTLLAIAGAGLNTTFFGLMNIMNSQAPAYLSTNLIVTGLVVTAIPVSIVGFKLLDILVVLHKGMDVQKSIEEVKRQPASFGPKYAEQKSRESGSHLV